MAPLSGAFRGLAPHRSACIRTEVTQKSPQMKRLPCQECGRKRQPDELRYKVTSPEGFGHKVCLHGCVALQRRTPLGKPAKPMKARKADPTKRRFAKHRDPKYTAWIKTLCCLTCGARPVDPAHVIPRSRGSDDRDNLVPLCRMCHSDQEGRTAAFEVKHGVNLLSYAKMLTRLYDKKEAA